MTSRLNPYISFRTEALEAMTFYHSILGGELVTNTFGEYFQSGDAQEDAKIMHAQLTTDNGMILMASDTPNSMPFQPGTNITISLSGDDGDALRGYFEALAEGGQISVPLEKQMWGDEFGQLVDKFGIGWLVNIGQPA